MVCYKTGFIVDFTARGLSENTGYRQSELANSAYKTSEERV